MEFASTIDYRGDYPVRIVLHEYAHAITVKALQDNPSLLKKAKELRNYVLSKATDKQKKEFYGLYGDKIDKDTQDEEAYEFIAEALTNPKFQIMLNKIPSISENKNVLEDIKKFFNAIVKFVTKNNESKFEINSVLADTLNLVI